MSSILDHSYEYSDDSLHRNSLSSSVLSIPQIVASNPTVNGWPLVSSPRESNRLVIFDFDEVLLYHDPTAIQPDGTTESVEFNDCRPKMVRRNGKIVGRE